MKGDKENGNEDGTEREHWNGIDRECNSLLLSFIGHKL